MAISPPSKAKKILRRTLVGGSLVCVVAALLWWTSVAGARPLFYVAAILTLAAAWETSRMGSLALYDLFPSLALAAFAVLALVNAGLESAAVAAEARPLSSAVFFQAGPSLLYGFALVTGLAAYSLRRLVNRLVPSRTTARIATFLVVGALVLFALDDVHARDTHLSLVLWILGGLSVLGLLAREPGGFARLSLAGLLCAWIVPALPLLVFFHQDPRFGTKGLIALLVLSKIGDTCGYYVGSAIGKSHPFPKISPGKTTAGCVGSLVGAVLAGAGLWALHVVPDGPLGLVGACLAAAVVNLAAQTGDLLESFVKRKAGVKDSSGAFGPSGGLLDQLDSLLVSVPVACLVWPILLA